MSRETQFIGLTKAAEDFVSPLQKLPSDSSTRGMFGEEIPLRRWEMHPRFTFSKTRENACIREVVQFSPWSSGPMLFTCLEIDFGNGSTEEVLGWIQDPMIKHEFDQESGRMWI